MFCVSFLPTPSLPNPPLTFGCPTHAALLHFIMKGDLKISACWGKKKSSLPKVEKWYFSPITAGSIYICHFQRTSSGPAGRSCWTRPSRGTGPPGCAAWRSGTGRRSSQRAPAAGPRCSRRRPAPPWTPCCTPQRRTAEGARGTEVGTRNAGELRRDLIKWSREAFHFSDDFPLLRNVFLHKCSASQKHLHYFVQ